MTNTQQINTLLEQQWANGMRPIAKNLENECRNKFPNIKIFSCRTAEILDQFITMDKDMIAMKKDVQILQAEDDPVLIVGETGTGKELIAKALHGSRSGKFIAVNCTAMPNELIESELFGHAKGSFTGAINDRVGKFQAAWGGTLFLDEIGDMPLDMQTKLLRVLQEKVYSPIGSNNEEKVCCRVIAATNKTIEQLLGGLHFREDLFYRLSTFILQTKPLVDRMDDIRHIVDSLGGENLPDDTAWNLKGNVRSLQAQIRRWLVLGKL